MLAIIATALISNDLRMSRPPISYLGSFSPYIPIQIPLLPLSPSYPCPRLHPHPHPRLTLIIPMTVFVLKSSNHPGHSQII